MTRTEQERALDLVDNDMDRIERNIRILQPLVDAGHGEQWSESHRMTVRQLLQEQYQQMQYWKDGHQQVLDRLAAQNHLTIQEANTLRQLWSGHDEHARRRRSMAYLAESGCGSHSVTEGGMTVSQALEQEADCVAQLQGLLYDYTDYLTSGSLRSARGRRKRLRNALHAAKNITIGVAYLATIPLRIAGGVVFAYSEALEKVLDTLDECDPTTPRRPSPRSTYDYRIHYGVGHHHGH